ncbi:LysM peptidoglycan-binding domain-containing protein [Halomonas maura]|uniref:LysM peptidoglycan-binding domain-containing protein n=1 Tax=Halomonas maura TaxID=117606 RepID=UPI0025B491E5|nr:LysM peptidoglycan-binding domain-containing protein [Halomonas maura]MDN3556889.1 LysM peptidoglycan-binding domain-containing protein [Halomonas maura]
MARIPAILRLSPKLALAGNAAFFAKAVATAAAKPPPPPPNPPQYSAPQVATPVQWNGGNTTFHPVQATNSTPFPGYGVYSPEYLEAMSLDLSVNQDDPYLIPDSYAPAGGEDPLQDVPTVEPVDNIETDEATAEDIVDDVAEGKSIAQVAEEYGISPLDVLDQLEAGGLEVEATQSDDGSESTVEIVDGETDETVVEYRFTEQPDGVVVEESTNADGETTTTVIDEQGNRTELDPEQETTREGAYEIVDGVADGQSLDEIAEEQGLTRAQVVAQLEAAGFDVESDRTGQGPSLGNTTEITDKESGEPLVHQETKPDGTTVSQRTDDDGNEVRHTVHPDGSTTTLVTEPDGRKTETQVDADGKTTETVTYEQNGVTVEEVTGDDGETTTTIIDEDGERTTLDPGQETTREGIDGIAEALAAGQSIDAIAEERDLTREQIEAQLRAAGYVIQSETNALGNGGEQYTTSIVDAEDGEEVIASHSSGRGTGNSSVYIDAEGNETRRTEYGNGTVIETVIDADGRETRTTTVAENDGEAIEYEVQDGDYLIAIAERHGVTLEELEESNPELFDSPRDPNVIHEGETVVIEGATQTTVEVTDNGYTLTTSPDGSMTLRRDEDGLEVDIEPATPEKSLTELLMGLDGDSDEEQALQGILESILLGSEELARIEELEEELAGLEEETQAAIDEILGDEGDADDVIKPASDAAGDDPGTPPDEEAPSGGDWEAVRRNGVWVWVDAELVEAIEAEEAARRARDEALSAVMQRQLQLDIYALEPEHEGAGSAALERLNAAGEAHGVYWELPEPEDSLEETQERLEDVNSWIDYLDAEREWQARQEEAQDIEERLLALYEEDEEYSRYFDEDGYEFTVSRGRAGSQEKHTGELLEQEVIERDGQLWLVNTYENMDEEEEVQLTYAPGDAPGDRPDQARDLDQEWESLMRGGDPLELNDIRQSALDAEREENPHYFEAEGYEYEVTSQGRGGRTTRDKNTGELLEQDVIERDGQLYLVNTYAHEEVEIQLTQPPGEAGRTEAQQQVDEDWTRWKADRASAEDGLIDVTESYNEAREAYQEMLAEQFAEQRAGLEGEDGEIATAQQSLDDVEERLGDGSLVPDGEATVPIERDDGETWYVHPEVAAAHEVLNDAEERLAEYERLEDEVLEAYREQHPDRFGDNYRYYDASRDLRGEGRMQSAGRFSENDVNVTVQDGQLHLTIIYENHTLETPLTYAPGDVSEGMERSETQQRLDQEWADWVAGGSLEEATTAKEEAQTSYDDTVEEYGRGGTEQLTDSLPDDVDPVLVPIIDDEMGEGMRWVHPEVAAAQEALVLLEEQRDSLEASEWHARMEAYRAAQPSTWQLLDGGTSAAPASEGPGPAEAWQWEDAYLELEGGYLQAQQALTDSREARILTQIGLGEAGISSMENAPEEWQDQHPELELANELDALESEVASLRESLEENDEHRRNIERSSRFNAHLLEQEETHRLDPDNWPEIVTAFKDQEADDARVEAGLDTLPEERVVTIDEELDESLGEVFGTEDAELIDPVADQIRDLGDDGDEVEIIPILYQEDGTYHDTALFRMGEDDTHPWLIDDSGSRYRNFADFQYNNYLSEDGQVYVPENLAEIADISGDIQYEWQQAREKSFTEEWLDPIIGIGTSIATVAAFMPLLAPVAAPIAFAGGAYFAARSIDNLASMQRHGRSWASAEGVMEGAMLATSVLPMVSSGLRFAAMTARGVDGAVAARTSIGAFNARRLDPNHARYAPEYAHASQLLSQPGGAFSAARWADVGAMGIGAPLLGYSGYNIAAHWEEMSSLERHEAVMGVASGIFGTGMGYRGLRASWPNQGGAREQAPPSLPELNRTSTPWSTSGEFSTTTRLYPTAHVRAGSEAIDTAALQARSGGESPTPTAANHPPHGGRSRGNMGPYVFRADTRSPQDIEAAGGFHPREPTGIWVDDPKGVSLSNYVLANTPGRFVGTSGSVEGIKAFVSQESRAAKHLGHTFVYILNPSNKRLHVPGEFEALGHPVSDHMGQVNEMAVDGSISWNEVLGWRQVDPNGNFVGEFVRNPTFGETSASPVPAARPRRYFSEATGETIADRVYGAYPESEGHIYVQSEGAQAERGDSSAVADKTHILIRDPETDERVLMPWIRGAAEGHVPDQGDGINPQHIEAIAARLARPAIDTQTRMADHAVETQQRLTEASSTQAAARVRSLSPETEGLARVYRLEDIEALNRASNDGALPPGHYVHLIRPPELDTGTFALQRGTVPRSGVVDDGGHFRWPAGREVNVANRHGRIYAVVSELSASQIRERFRRGEGLPFALYSGKGLWSMASKLSAHHPQSPPAAEKPSHITQFSETTQKNTSEQQVPPATIESQQYRSQGSSETPQRKSRSEKVIGSILGVAGAAGASLSTHPLADAIAFAARGASLIARSRLPNHTKVDQFWGRVLRGLEFCTLSVNLPGSANAVMQGSNVDINLPYSAGHLAYIIKNYVEATTGRPFAPYADDVALPLYLAGSVPYTASSLRGGDHGAFVDATGAAGGGLFVAGSALLWVQGSATWQKGVKPIITKLWPVTSSSTKLPQENSTLPRMNGESEASSQKSESKLKPTLTTPLTYGIGLGFFAASSAAVAWSNSRNEREDDLDVDEDPTVEPPSDDENDQEVDETPTVEPPSDDENDQEVDEAPTVEPPNDEENDQEVDEAPMGGPPSDDENGHEDEGPKLEPLGGNERARFNLELEHRGHDWVEVESHLSLGGIAISRGHDVAEVVELNLGHIGDPGALQPGDRVYLPKRELA